MEIYEDRNGVFLVFEYIKGVMLDELYKQNSKFSLVDRDRKVIVSTLVKTLKFINSKGIIHRDIKPENIMILQARQPANISISPSDVKLIDFGLADYIFDSRGRKREHKLRCGTIGYLAPEMIQQGLYDERIDIFCIGLVMYELCTSKQLFDRTGRDQRALLRLNHKCDFDLEEVELEENAHDLLSRLLEKEPNKRISLDKALRHQWFQEITENNLNQFIERNRNHIGSSYNISRISFLTNVLQNNSLNFDDDLDMDEKVTIKSVNRQFQSVMKVEKDGKVDRLTNRHVFEVRRMSDFVPSKKL